MDLYEEAETNNFEEIDNPVREGDGQFCYNPNGGQNQVLFPYGPYQSQMEMLDAIDNALNASENCLLESPTGTGKTAALLCGPLAWRREQIQRNPDVNPPVIFYATRTQCQIQHVVNQLKQTVYADTPMAIFASRKHTCLNALALASTSVDATCETMRANTHKSKALRFERSESQYPTCQFYERFTENEHVTNFLPERDVPWDIEDMKNFGRDCGICPYYGMKALQARAALILCTHNHLLHKWIRRSLNLNVGDSIIIFDEAHNLESACRDIASKRISRTKLEEVILKELASLRGRPGIPEDLDELLRAIQLPFKGLLRFMDETRTLYASSVPLKEDEIVSKFTLYGFGPVTIKLLDDQLSRLYVLSNDEEGNYSEYVIAPATTQAINSIVFTFHMLFERISAIGANEVADFGVNVVNNGYETELCITCLDPKVVFGDMETAKTVVVSSGTLSPLESYQSELGITFQHRVITSQTPGRVISSVISLSKWNNEVCKFNFNYANRQDVTRIIHLGRLLVDVCKFIPNGILVFVASKEYTRDIREIWEEDILPDIKALKQTFWEYEANAHTFCDFIKEYRKAAQQGKGAIMFAVFRGRISEGMDFPGAQARAVVTVGIPYRPLNDPKVMRKKNYNDRIVEKYPEREYLGGFAWYRNDAFRAFNQAIGRCIRHQRDWGVILMVDERLNDDDNFIRVSSWVTQAQAPAMEKSLETLQPLLENFISQRIMEEQQ